jgi:hypothetical protein
MEAAGFPQSVMVAALTAFSLAASTGNLANQLHFANLGWKDAANGLIPTISGEGH